MNTTVSLRVWGEFACFTRPEMKVERVSYRVPTPSAARGVLEAVFWEPEMYYLIDSITVVRPELLAALDGRLGSVCVLPLTARVGRAPEHVILRAKKSGRAAFRLLAPLVLHDGPAHESDRENYTTAVRAVLRTGAALPWAA